MPSEVAPVKSANPAPLGLAAFGLTTIVLSAINAGLLPREAVPVVVPLAFAYGGVAQIIAGILEFRTGNTFGMVAFTSYGLFWWWFAFLQWTIGAGWLKAPPPAAGGVVLLAWGVFTFLLWIVTFRLSKAVFSIFLLLWITFFLLAAGDFGYGTGQNRRLHRPPHRHRRPLRSLPRDPQRRRRPRASSPWAPRSSRTERTERRWHMPPASQRFTFFENLLLGLR